MSQQENVSYKSLLKEQTNETAKKKKREREIKIPSLLERNEGFKITIAGFGSQFWEQEIFILVFGVVCTDRIPQNQER